MLKPFNMQTFNDDDDAKYAVINLFRSWNCDVRVNADDYGIDLIGRDKADGALFGVEVEVKHNWHGPWFPFDTVHYPARKTKFMDAMGEVYFCTVNTDRTHCLLLSVSQQTNARLVRKQSSVTSSEWFIEFPIHLFATYEL